MNRSRLKLVHKRKPQEDDLSFMPPYAEQAKYLMLADRFLALDGTHDGRGKVLSIEMKRNLQSKEKRAA